MDSLRQRENAFPFAFISWLLPLVYVFSVYFSDAVNWEMNL